VQTYGNPAAAVTEKQVETLRGGGSSSPLVIIVRLAMLLGAVLVLCGIVWIGLRIRARYATSPAEKT